MPNLTGGQALIQSLAQAGVQVVFGIPGAGQYEAVDALYETPSIRYISVRHEQATSYMADGYARASGQIAGVLVVSGPGVFNASAGIATAYASSSPMLVITGTHHQDHADDHADLAWWRALTQWAARAQSPAQIPALVQEAFRQLRTGRPRPVALEISAQVFAATEEVQLRPAPIEHRPAGQPERIDQAARSLAAAHRPAIWAGGGVHRAGAWAPLQALAEHLQAPVVTTPQGKGALSDRHSLSLGLAELRYAPLHTWLEDRDVILAVGTRTDFAQRFQQAQIIQIDIDQAQLGQANHILTITGDACHTLQALYEAIVAATPARPSLAAEVAALNAARFDPARQLQPQWGLMRAIRAALPEDGILVQGMNQMGYYSRNYFPVYAPRTYLTSSQLATLGAAFPLALGAKVARPEQAVVAVEGDGGFLYNAQELATAVQYGINVVVIVFNDNAYGNVLRAQIEQFDGHILGTQLRNPDFVQLALAYGARGVRAQDASQLEAALRQALTLDAPTLIEVPVGMMKREY
jgi:acetolactate synthase-1/2/3 large subunit